MQRLNIPLKTGNTTTRLRNRRVVWPVLAVILAVVGVFAVVQMGTGRTSLLLGAPKGAAVFDVVGHKALSELSKHLGDIPLFSDRPLTLNSLLPYIHREVLLAVLDDDRRLVVFAGELPSGAKGEMEHVGVSVTWVDGLTILSNTPEVIPNWGRGLGFHLSAVFPDYAGMARLEGRSYAISLNDSSASLTGVRGRLPQAGTPPLPASTVAWVPFNAQNTGFSSYFSALFGYGLDQSMRSILEGRQGELLLTIDKAGWGYRLMIEGDVESQKLAQVLQSSVGLAHPITRTTTLSDGTRIDELQTDLQEVVMSVEETSAGVIVKADQGDTHLMARRTDRETIITNRPELLDLSAEDGYLKISCGGSVALIRPAAISKELGKGGTIVDSSLSLWSKIELLGVYKGKWQFCW